MSKYGSNVIVKNRLYIIGAIIGALSGYFYWYYIGCSMETCPITSSWLGTSVAGSILGSLIFGMFVGDENARK
jgi:predicted membrane protein